jgi:nucleotide-binding universal stress UspA family protein
MEKMVVEKNDFSKTGRKNSNQGGALRMLVAIDFSPTSYTTLEYAMNLAKSQRTPIELFHIIDFDELSETDNPLVMDRMLTQIEEKARIRLESLIEMLTEQSVEVTGTDLAIGKVEHALRKKIKDQGPYLVIAGANQWGGKIKNHIKSFSSAFLLIPENMPWKSPHTIGIYGRQQNLNQIVKPILYWAWHDKQIILLGQDLDKNFNSGTDLIEGTPILLEKVSSPISSLQQLQSVIKELEIDLLCVDHKKKTFWGKWLERRRFLKITSNLKIPVLFTGS